MISPSSTSAIGPPTAASGETCPMDAPRLAPAGPTYMEDLNEAGGVYAVMNELKSAGLLNEDCMTVTGKTIGEAVDGVAKRIRKLSVHWIIHIVRPVVLQY